MILKHKRNSFEGLSVASWGVSIRRNIVIYHFQLRSGIRPIRYKNHAEKYRLKWKHTPYPIWFLRRNDSYRLMETGSKRVFCFSSFYVFAYSEAKFAIESISKIRF